MRCTAALVVVSVLAGAGSAFGEMQVTPVTTSPKGAYVVARLEISEGLQGEKGGGGGGQKLFIALRDGKLANVWFVRAMDGDQRLMVEKSTLALDGAKLAGEVEFRSAFNRGNAQGSLKATFDLAVAGEKVSGSYALEPAGVPYKAAKGTAAGVLLTAARPEDAVKGSWTSFWGTSGDMSAGPQPTLVDELAKARPVWRSETYVPTGYGNAPDSRYYTRAAVAGNGGGGSSPVVADGTVFQYFYVPSPQSGVATGAYLKDEGALKEHQEKMKLTAREMEQIRGHFRAVADDHVVAIDAATGAEKWHTVLPLRSPNLQTHKHRGISGVPLVVGDTVYVPNLMARLYAIDAKTGAVKWESPEYKAPDAKGFGVSPSPNPSPMMIGETLVFARGASWNGTVSGLDPATGKEKWKTAGSYLMRWTSGGKTRLVTIIGLQKRELVCIDPAEGKVLWKQETELAAGAPLSAVIAGDMLLADPTPPKASEAVHAYEGWKLSETGAAKVWKDQPIKNDENIPVTVCDGRAYICGAQIIRVLDVATGRQITERKFEKHGPGSNPWLGVVGDRLLFSPEGQHGGTGVIFLDKDLKDMGAMWETGHVHTSAYNSQPIVFPVVDGRVFMRGGDGVYCYDLRGK